MSKPGTIRYANNACIRLTYLIIFLSYLLFIIIYMKYVWQWPKQTIFSLLSCKQKIFSHCQLLSLFVDVPQRQSLSGTQHNQMIMNSQIQSAQVFPVSSAIITRELTNKLSANSLLASFILQIKVEITQAALVECECNCGTIMASNDYLFVRKSVSITALLIAKGWVHMQQ